MILQFVPCAFRTFECDSYESLDKEMDQGIARGTTDCARTRIAMRFGITCASNHA